MYPYSQEGKNRMEWDRDEIGLVWAAQVGSLPAFDQLVRRFRPAAMMTATSILKNRELADDAVQDAFVLAYKSLPRLADVTRFGSWFAAIVRNRSLRLLAGRPEAPLPIDSLILSYVPAIQRDLEKDEERSAVWCAIRELAEDIQVVVRLYYLHDWSVAAISEYLDVPKTTVKWRLHTARRQLKTLLSDEIEEPL